MRSVVDKYSGLPFSYGQDCCQFVGECIESITGVNPIEDLHYSTEAEAIKIIKKHGGMQEVITHYLGEPYDGCKDGDACMIDNNNGELAAAMIYKGRVVARVESGLMDYPIERALMVWCT